ncbi:MAG: N-acetyltransferase [Chloroflexota bacterium]|nr:MAG: N-acetyltransferase [Chloroflexota bacterium]
MIYGERIRFRAIEREDLPRFAAWLNDPEVRSGLSLFLPMSLAEEESWYEAMLKRPAAEHPLTIEVNQADIWTPIGNMGLFQIDERNRSAEVGIFIGEKSYWNKGYGSEAMRLMLRHGFNTLNLHRIYLRVYETNLRAIRSYEKAGFIHEGRMRKAEFQEGCYIDILLMSILQPEWKESFDATGR